MIIEIPDHYAGNIGESLVYRAEAAIDTLGMIPSWIHQLADAWDRGLRYRDESFWQVLCDRENTDVRIIIEQHGGLL